MLVNKRDLIEFGFSETKAKNLITNMDSCIEVFTKQVAIRTKTGATMFSFMAHFKLDDVEKIAILRVEKPYNRKVNTELWKEVLEFCKWKKENK